MRSNTVSQNHFANIENPQIQRSVFDRSSMFKGSFEAGKLIPFFVDEALPGDTFTANVNLFGRLATPIKPFMDNLYIDVHFFAVPNRLVWDNWQRFMGEQPDPDSTTDFLIPTLDLSATQIPANSNGDYMGLPTEVTNLTNISALPFRALTKIWNEWYRDQNLQDSKDCPTDDGPDLPTNYHILMPRNKRKDYFTSALPWAQKGEPVLLPLGTSAPVTYTGAATDALGIIHSNTGDQVRMSTNVSSFLQSTNTTTTNSLMFADLSAATAATVNQLREAFQLQRMFEKDARGGTRYTEIIRSHFGVTSPDARLQRPEYIGGGTLNVNVNPIAQTAPSVDDVTPQGNLAAMGTFKSSGQISFHKSFTEHEIIIGVLSARADLTYQQGVNKMWLRQTRNDFYWPTFAHLGEQAILNKEIYAQGGSTTDEEVFGYQERYAEYRYKPGVITSAFRSNYATSLDVWHLAQDFQSAPSLNSSFIEENPPIGRVIAVPSEPAFLVDSYTQLKCVRPMPTYSTPGFIDHF